MRSRTGLDCSGYVGWCVYNMLNPTNGKAGFVMLAQKMAKNFASRGWGELYGARCSEKFPRRGYYELDLSGLRACLDCARVRASDGSVVMLHASPPGVPALRNTVIGPEERTAKQ